MSHRANSAGWLPDGNLAFHGGADASVPPSDIARNQVAHAINCTMRRGPIAHRPGWTKLPLVFEDETQASAFQTAMFQHGSSYASVSNPSLISSQGGRLFLVNLINYAVREITPLNPDNSLDRNSALLNIGWSVQMGTYWAYQDNQSWAVIFNGNGCRRSNPTKSEIPVGNVMGYAHGRLIVALPDRHSYRCGDLLFGPSGTPGNNYRDAVLRFTENNFLNEGGDFQARVYGAPSDDGPITAIKPIAMTDTQLGLGPLMIGTPYNMFTVRLPYDRTTWKDMANPQQTDSPIMGTVGQDSMVLVNTDVWYRSIDGIRSYIMAQRQFLSWGNTPMSAEIDDVLSQDSPSLLEHGSAVLFDNRLLQTACPTPSRNGAIYHQMLAVMDFNLVSTINKKMGPVWEGFWTGLNILKILKCMVRGEERCFAYVLNCNEEIEIWELSKDKQVDGEDTEIDWSFELPSYNCGNSDQLKKLEIGRIIVTDLKGNLDGTVDYRSDQNECWNSWDTFNVCAKQQDCCYDLETTTAAQFVIPAVSGTVAITVASTSGMTLTQPEVTIGAFTLTITNIDIDGVTVTLQNDSAEQVGGIVQQGVTVEFCGYDCAGPHTYRPQSRTPIRLHAPPDVEDPVSGHFKNRGYEFQPRVSLTGTGKVRQIRIFAKDEPDIAGADRREDV